MRAEPVRIGEFERGIICMHNRGFTREIILGQKTGDYICSICGEERVTDAVTTVFWDLKDAFKAIHSKFGKMVGAINDNLDIEGDSEVSIGLSLPPPYDIELRKVRDNLINSLMQRNSDFDCSDSSGNLKDGGFVLKIKVRIKEVT